MPDVADVTRGFRSCQYEREGTIDISDIAECDKKNVRPILILRFKP